MPHRGGHYALRSGLKPFARCCKPREGRLFTEMPTQMPRPKCIRIVCDCWPISRAPRPAVTAIYDLTPTLFSSVASLPSAHRSMRYFVHHLGVAIWLHQALFA